MSDSVENKKSQSKGLLGTLRRRSSKSKSRHSSDYEMSSLDDSGDETTTISTGALRVRDAVDDAVNGPKTATTTRFSKERKKKKGGAREKRRSLLMTYGQLEHMVQSQHQQYQQLATNPLHGGTSGQSTTQTTNNDMNGAGGAGGAAVGEEVERLQSKLDYLAKYIIEDHNALQRIEAKIDAYDDENGTDCRACCAGFL